MISHFKSVYNIITLLSPKGKRKFTGSIIAGIIFSFAEFVGIGSIVPLLITITNVDIILEIPILKWVYDEIANGSYNFFVTILVVSVISLIFIRNILYIIELRFSKSFTNNSISELSFIIFNNHINKNYLHYIKHNSADLYRNIMIDIRRSVDGYVAQTAMLLTSFFRLLLIIALLIIIGTSSVFIISAFIIILYYIIFILYKKRIYLYGKNLHEGDTNLSRTVSDTFQGMKELTILQRKGFFIDKFLIHIKDFCNAKNIYEITLSLQVAFHDMIFIVGMLIVGIFAVISEGSLLMALPLIGGFAYSGLRLRGVISTISNSFFQINNNKYVSDICFGILNERSSVNEVPRDNECLNLKDKIELRDVNFSYIKNRNFNIKNFNISIKLNTTIGLVGSTGCGKTTIVDIILGLLQPTSGNVIIDETTLTDKTIPQWQKIIGYVPQDIHLRHATIAENVAFGIHPKDFNWDQIKEGTRLANLAHFVENDLPDQYNTIIGDRGVLLSGGQRQRIGIARALYHSPKVLVFDEATSALDSITEKVVIEAIHKLQHTKTIIVIAHRISTIQEADCIYIMEDGKIIDSGTYRQLIQNNKIFKDLANLH